MNPGPHPVRLLGVTVDSFRGWSGQHRLPLGPGLTVLVGINGAGKSSLVNAVEWCLFGAQVSKKSSGLDERADWEIANREQTADPSRAVEVLLELEVDAGGATLLRRRDGESRQRDPDEVRLELPGGSVLEGPEAEAWLAASGLPDWQTWKHAFCQHQEQSRGRVVDSAERSVQLGRLLGLDQYRKTSEGLRALKTRDLAQAAQAELDSIEDELTRSLERPDRELRELEDRLERHGVARTEIGESTFQARAVELVEGARRIAALLDLDGAMPDPTLSSAAEILRWAQDWSPAIQARRQTVDRERADRVRELGELEAALQGIEPAQRRRRDAHAAWKRWTEEYGTAERLAQEAETLGQERERLRSAERERDERTQLLRQAVELVSAAEHDDSCPICGHEASDLMGKLRARLDDAGAGAAGAAAEEREEALRGRGRRLAEQRAQLAGLESDLEVTEAEHGRLSRQLEARLPADGSDLGPEDVQRGWQNRIREQQRVLDQIDEHLGRHRTEVDVLELLSKWQAGRARADAATGGLAGIEAWDDLQAAIDDAARLAVDLDAIEQMARDAQAERSEERVREVNETLGLHYGRITGESAGAGVRVVVKATASKLSYQLVDADDRNITPILNQAALNALSLAMLFAQAEDRASRELPQWLLLDDPGQSLDERSVAGLAQALAAIAPRVPTLVATFPGALSEALARSAGQDGRVFRIATDARGHGTGLEEVSA